jgi:probable rRNA maturation factor
LTSMRTAQADPRAGNEPCRIAAYPAVCMRRLERLLPDAAGRVTLGLIRRWRGVSPRLQETMGDSDQSPSLDLRGLPAGQGRLGRLCKKIARDLLAGHGITSYAVSISFVDEGEIRRLNRKALHRSGSTDVIAFNLSEEGLPYDTVGDVYVSLDAARANSERYGVPLEEEVLRLVVHGVLHVVGYSDDDAGGRHRMSRVQEDIVKRYSGGSVS